jgi:hypothetical protein
VSAALWEERGQVTAAYEAVRTAALDKGAGIVPSGGAGVIMSSGLPAWLVLWTASPSPAPAPPPQPTDLPSVVPALPSDLVLILASMVLGHAPAVHP